jgi:ketosteroid isomerase-like protein
MMKTKPVSYLLRIPMVLGLLCAPAFATTVHSPDEAAVKALTERFGAIFARGDLKAISLLYTDDAKLLPPNETAVSGRAAILAWFEKNIRPVLPARIRFSHYEIYGGGDAATSISEMQIYDGEGRIMERGKQTIVLVKQNGEWKIHRDMWSDNTPANAGN